MSDFTVKETKNKSIGLFALRDFHKGEHILHVDLTEQKRYFLRDFEENHNLDGDHATYVGYGKYVIEDSLAACMNHSCSPNCYLKMRTLAVYDVHAWRDIEKGEELTHDYTATSVDQFAGKGFWTLKCNCGSKNCRRTVDGDFFKLPVELQRKYYPNLPSSVKRKYRKRFGKLRL